MIKNPEKKLKKALKIISGSNWEEQFSGLDILRSVIKHHIQVYYTIDPPFQPLLHEVNSPNSSSPSSSVFAQPT